MPTYTRFALLLTLCVHVACADDPVARARAYAASGDKYAAEGKTAEAIVQYRNAVQQQPRSGETRYKLAEAYAKSEDPLRAFQEFIHAADLLPEHREAQTKAITALLLARRFDEAKVRAERLVARYPQDGEALVMLANALAGLNDLDTAIKQVEEAITLDPSEPRRRAALGAIYLAQGDARLAEQAFKRALTLKPGDEQVLLALGNFYWSVGRVAEAETMFSRAQESSPDSLEPNRALATLYASTGRMAKAEPFLKRTVSLSPGVRPQLALADYYVTINRTPDAEDILNRLLKQPDAASEAKSRLAALDYERGDKAKAYGRLDEVLRDDTKNLRARLLKVQLLVKDSRNDEAAVESARALEADPSSAAAHYVHGVLLESKGDRGGARREYNEVLRLNPRAVAAQVRLSDISLQDGTVDLAVQFAAQALRDDPSNDDARMKLARALLARRDLDGAQKEVAALLTRYPSSAAVQTLAGLLKTQQRDFAAARNAFNKALTTKPHSADALAGMLAVDMATSNVDQSRARIDKSLAALPDDPELLIVSARAALVKRDWTRAEQALRHVLKVDAGNLMAYAMLGTAYANQGKLDDARQEFAQLADRDKTSVAAPTMVAVIFHTQNRLEETKTWYERALKVDSTAPVAANNLAWITAQEQGDLDRALQLATLAADRLPKNPEVHDTLGWVRFHRKEYTEAIVALKQSVEEDPSNPIYLYHLGLAHARAGQTNEARQSLKRALSLKPDFDGASDAQKLLTEL
jgi:tetratricopeptide (TPR) repeat protein